MSQDTTKPKTLTIKQKEANPSADRKEINQAPLDKSAQQKVRLHHQVSNMIQASGFLKRSLRSLQISTLFEELEHWFQQRDRDEEHWRFSEPCHHPLYQPGEIWQEKTGLSRKVWRKVFPVIGTHYLSKSVYLKEADPFQGKLYVSYYDRKENLTHYIKNPDLES